MSRKPLEFQPGAILHDVLIGAFRAQGRTFDGWCKENGYSPMNVRNATFGQSRGVTAKAYLEHVIEGAGREFVRDAYARRLAEHAAQFAKGAA